LPRLINAKQVVCMSLGMAISMSFSSLTLWESNWLATSVLPLYDAHGISVLIGVLTCAISFAWSCVSPSTLRAFLEKALPPIMIVALLVSRVLPDTAGFTPLGVVLGFIIPSAGAYLLTFVWFHAMAARDIENGLLSLLLAWAFSVPLRAFFGLFEAESVRLAISVLLVCATWWLLLAQSRQIDASLPMIANVPRENKESYVHALGSIWKCTLYCGTFAFLGGVVRSLSLQADAMVYINYASILGGLVSALALMVIWKFRTIRYSINHLFRVLFPFLVLLMCALPFFGAEAFFVPAAALYIVYSFMSLSMQALCIQTAHDYGVSPLFCASFQIGVSVSMQGLGYQLGDAANSAYLSQIPSLATISLISLAVLALVMYVTRGLSISQETDGRNIEFLSLTRKPHEAAVSPDGVAGSTDNENPTTKGESPAASYENNSNGTDNLSMRCDAIGKEYYLSQREIEVMHLFMQGYTMAAIAKELYISENTVKTHTRRLYAKLGINKKQQLFNLVNNPME